MRKKSSGFFQIFILFFFSFCSHSAFSQHLGNMMTFEKTDHSVLLKAEHGNCRVVFYSSDILGIDYSPQIPDTSFVIIRDTSTAVFFSVNESDSFLIFDAGDLFVQCQKYPLSLKFYHKNQEILSEPPAGGFFRATGENSIQFLIGEKTHFYGSGERGRSLDLRGLSFQLNNTPAYGYHEAQPTMNINVSFLATSAGAGLLFDHWYPAEIDIGNSQSDILTYKTRGKNLRYFVIAGENVGRQLEGYIYLTGRQPLPPKWAFGYLQSSYGYRTEAEAREIVRTMRQKKIPCDAIILDLDWFDQMGDLSWDLSNFPQPHQMMSDFLQEGIKTIVITEPYVTQYSRNFSPGYALGYFGKNSQGLPYLLENWWSCNCNAALVDFTNPEAQDWWWQKHPDFFGDELAGIWTDLGEPEQHPADMMHFLGPAEKIHNFYNLLWAEAIFQGYQSLRPDSRLFNLTRSGCAGIQRYAVIPWSGDVGVSFSGMAAQIPLMLNCGLSGLAYLHSDIGGFTGGDATPELYVRWVQLGAFSPIMRAHGVDYQPQEPWGYGDEAEAIAKKFIELRYQLLPYIYSLAWENYLTGKPILRPLYFDENADESFFNNYDSFLFGNALLISPVTASGVTSKTFRIPSDVWFDFWTDEVFIEPSSVTLDASLSKMPILVRGGSIIPMAPVMNYVDEMPAETLFVHIYPFPGKSGNFTLYEDDGRTLRYQQGEFALTNFSNQITESDGQASLEISVTKTSGSYASQPINRTYLLVIHRMNEPEIVKLNGEMLSSIASLSELRQNGDGYFYSGDEHRLFIQFSAQQETDNFISVSPFLTTTVKQSRSSKKENFLFSNYPNPLNSSTIIPFALQRKSHVTIKIYNLLGEKVKLIDIGEKNPGQHRYVLDSTGLASGLYFYELVAEKFSEHRKFLVVK